MATDFNKNVIVVSGGIIPSTTNTPNDVRTRINTIDDVPSIPLPYVGMIFYVVDEGAYYSVKSLKSGSAAGQEIPNMLIDEYIPLPVSGGGNGGGVQGPAGKDGKSAYEIAVEKGFEGEEQAWLESLKGKDGAQGEKGETGPIGPQGLQGPAGVVDTSNFYTKPEINDKFQNIDAHSINGLKFWKGSQDSFNDIAIKDENTIYLIEEEESINENTSRE